MIYMIWLAKKSELGLALYYCWSLDLCNKIPA